VRCADRTLYTGVAKDLAARISAHNHRRGAKYTRSRVPVRLVYRERAADRAAALKREHEIKRLSRAAKQALVARARRKRAKRQLMTENRRPSGKMIAFKK
jgi:predicted GIY-YIG superfamily endonuclease